MSAEWPEELSSFSRSRLERGESFLVGDHIYSADQIVSTIGPQLTEERKQRLTQVIAQRTYRVVPVLENLYDLGNLSAVLRSAEAFGFLEVNLVVPPGARFKAANRVARGADKWLDLQIQRSPKACAEQLRARGFRIYATHLEASVPLEELDFSKPTAIVLGNEKDGVSAEMLAAVDGRFSIPMQGFTQSFNLSVAAALTFYQAWRDRNRRLGQSGDLTPTEQKILLANYHLRCLDNPEAVLSRIYSKR